ARGPSPSQKRSHPSTAQSIEGIVGVTPSLSLRRHRARDLYAILGVDHVIAGERHGVLASRDLHLENHLMHVAEGHLAAGKIKLPHAAEAIIVARQLLDALAVG